MSYYIKLSTLDYPRHQGDIRLEHPEIGDEFICPNTYAEVFDPNDFTFDKHLQTVHEEPPSLIDGKWYKNYVIKNYTQQELDEIEQAHNLFLQKTQNLNQIDED
jgi:hypothetical protein